jgi:excisionase family DNA binding protein
MHDTLESIKTKGGFLVERLSFSVEETATLVGLSPQKVRRMIKAGEIRAIRAGKRVLVPRLSLEEFLQYGTEHQAEGIRG